MRNLKPPAKQLALCSSYISVNYSTLLTIYWTVISTSNIVKSIYEKKILIGNFLKYIHSP